MKKIITLLLCTGVFVTSYAQSNHWPNDDRIYRTEGRQDDHYSNSSYHNRNYDRDHKGWGHFKLQIIFSARERDFQVANINRDFDTRIEAIECNSYLGRHEKRKAIREAESARSRQIQLVYERFNCAR